MSSSTKRKDRGFTLIRKLGQGTFGCVTLQLKESTQEHVAVKRMNIDTGEGVPCTTLREVAILQALHHRNVVRFLGVEMQPQCIELHMEACDSDLKHRMRLQGRPFTAEETRDLGAQLMHGIAFLHGRGILHRDLKPQNVLVSSSDVLKIGDFGLARQFQPDRSYTLEVCTLWYRPPELLLGAKTYGAELDVWSAGCVLHEMRTNSPAFSGDSEIGMLFDIFRSLGTPTSTSVLATLPHWHADTFPNWPADRSTTTSSSSFVVVATAWEEALDELLREMWSYDPHSRPCAADVVHHRAWEETEVAANRLGATTC